MKIVISESEKKRILNLYETPSKINEEKVVNTWTLCSTNIYESSGKYYAKVSEGNDLEIPTLNQLGGTLNNSKQKNKINFEYNQITKSSVIVGEMMKKNMSCHYAKPNFQSKTILVKWFTAFDTKSMLPIFGQITPIGDISSGQGNNPNMNTLKDKVGTTILYQQSRSQTYMIEVSVSMVGKIVSEQIPRKVSTPFNFNLESPFIFDKTELTPEAETKFKELITVIKEKYQNVKGDVVVTTSASIDADPIKTETYNMNLSTQRANTIINRIKSESGNNSLNFVPKPIGQTDQFKPGLKWPEIKDNKLTAPNRRLIIKLPEIRQ